MKIVNSEIGIDLELKENQVNILVVEDPISFREIIQELNGQSRGVSGNFVLSHNNEPLIISKNMELIIDPFNIDLNSKKIQAKLYELIVDNFNNNLIEKMGELNQAVASFLEFALLEIPFPVEYDMELDSVGLLKFYHVGIQKENVEFAGNIIEYMRLQNSLLNVSVLIFVNLNTVLSETELKEVYKFAFYSKMNLVLIESQRDKQLDYEILTIVDKDRCVIRG